MVMGSLRQEAEVVVIGGGPGGYVAAIHAADLGKEVVLVEEREALGGVCLIEGCIPSKTLIHAVELIHAAQQAERLGIHFQPPTVDIEALRKWTRSVVDTLTKGVRGLLKRRGVEIVHGRARFLDNRSIAVQGGEVSAIEFQHCIIATGSRINELPGQYDLPLWTSADALALPEIPQRLLVVGGGYIGLELGLVYAGLGSEVTIAELFPTLLAGADQDLVKIMLRLARKRLKSILLESKVETIEQTSAGLAVTIAHTSDGESQRLEFDRVLVAVGRRPNTDDLGLETTRIRVDDHGRIPVDEQNRTVEPAIYAIGDVAPGPMLAHKASREGRVAAEVIAGQPAAFDNRSIPAVVFTDPELAWTGLTEREARAQGISVTVGKFPLRALGRARTIGRTDGLVKVISDAESNTILGVGMVGPHVSELIAEGSLAIEMGATLEDLMVTIHPHPTLSEALMEAAEAAAGHAVHLDPPRT